MMDDTTLLLFYGICAIGYVIAVGLFWRQL